MRSILARSLLGGVLLLAACDDIPEVSETTGAINYGTPTGTHPEIGFFLSTRGAQCTATLVAPRWVLTAGHCINFSNQTGGTFSTGNGTTTNNYFTYPVQEVFNLGPPGPISGDPTRWTSANTRHAADTSGNDDLALLLLRDAVGSQYTPAWIEHTLPDPGSTVSVIGYGNGNGNPLKQVASWSFALNTVGPQRRSVIDANGAIYQADIVGYELPTPGLTQEGDSGGPAIKGDVSSNPLLIWGVVSGGTAISNSFGAAAYLNKLICNAAYKREPHGLCVTGAPLIQPPQGCIWSDHASTDQELREKVINSVCARDNFCCNPRGSWDGQCVSKAAEARQALGVQCQ